MRPTPARLGRIVTTLALALAAGPLARVAGAQPGPRELWGPGAATVRVRPGFTPDPSNTDVSAGGTVEHPACGGFVSARPALVLEATARVRWLRIYASAAGDTALALRGPDGHWRCADDTYGVHPAVDGPLARGTWRIWVATPAAGAPSPAVLTVTARRAQRPAETPAAPQDPLTAATSLVQQVVTGVTHNAPPQLAPYIPNLTRAGLDPARLPGALGTMLSRSDAGVANLDPSQLGQLADLARRGLTAEQLQSVATALQRNTGSTQLTPAQLGRLGDLARQAGVTPERLRSAATAMLQPDAGAGR